MTSSGSLPCGNIIHYAHTGSPDYVDVTCRLLMKADEMNLTSISLPALGTGESNIMEISLRIFNICVQFSNLFLLLLYSCIALLCGSVYKVIHDCTTNRSIRLKSNASCALCMLYI